MHLHKQHQTGLAFLCSLSAWQYHTFCDCLRPFLLYKFPFPPHCLFTSQIIYLFNIYPPPVPFTIYSIFHSDANLHDLAKPCINLLFTPSSSSLNRTRLNTNPWSTSNESPSPKLYTTVCPSASMDSMWSCLQPASFAHLFQVGFWEALESACYKM